MNIGAIPNPAIVVARRNGIYPSTSAVGIVATAKQTAATAKRRSADQRQSLFDPIVTAPTRLAPELSASASAIPPAAPIAVQ